MEKDSIKVLFDHQIFSLQKYGGISRYIVELMKEFENMDAIKYELAIFLSENEYLRGSGNKNYHKINLKIENRVKNQLVYAANTPISLHKIKKGDFDIFHPTYYDSYFRILNSRKPVVVTVHDLTHELFPEFFNNPRRNTEMKRKIFERADGIIAISENTKKDLINIFGVSSEKITVVYHGNSITKNINIENFDDARKKHAERYILFVGVRSGYKNFDKFLVAVSDILREDKTLCVKCIGGGEFTSNEKEEMRKLKIENQVSQEQVTDMRLVELYSNALVFVFPSLYEGFGMPILEAMACGCPAILSNTSSLPEIGGNAAEYFNPTDCQSMQKAIVKVLTNNQCRNELIENGKAQMEKFSWKKCANETLGVYQKLL